MILTCDDPHFQDTTRILFSHKAVVVQGGCCLGPNSQYLHFLGEYIVAYKLSDLFIKKKKKDQQLLLCKSC